MSKLKELAEEVLKITDQRTYDNRWGKTNVYGADKLARAVLILSEALSKIDCTCCGSDEDAKEALAKAEEVISE